VTADHTIALLLSLPVLLAGASLVLRSTRAVLYCVAAGGLLWGVAAIAAAVMVFSLPAAVPESKPWDWPVPHPIYHSNSAQIAWNWLRMDVLSAFQFVVLGIVFAASSVYSFSYFRHEESAGHLTLRSARKFGSLWFGAVWAMSVVLLSNNMGLMWVGIEATTLLTAFLITIHASPQSLEAMWKYLLVCSVGVAFAFVGTLLVGASVGDSASSGTDALMWTWLYSHAHTLDTSMIKLAFIFLLVGYGTKAGLAPLHSWLPDAHSQAPAPVSALFSGAMLNSALYCIMRALPIVDIATDGSGWGYEILAVFGLISIFVAGAFIVFQTDTKRLLAYSSVEHIGVIAVSLSLGPLGTFAALFHTLNHSIAKCLAFFSIGRIGQAYSSHARDIIAGSFRTVPIWGPALFVAIFVLIGAAPFAVFMSELLSVKAAVSAQDYVIAGLFLLGLSIVFISALRFAITAAWGNSEAAPRPLVRSLGEILIVLVLASALLLLGLWMPDPMYDAIDRAAKSIGVTGW
jgi:hydrogenase-4 component F